MHHSVNKFTLVNYEHRYVLQVAGTPFHDAYELDPDAVKHTKKSFLTGKERMIVEVLLFLKIHQVFLHLQKHELKVYF